MADRPLWASSSVMMTHGWPGIQAVR